MKKFFYSFLLITFSLGFVNAQITITDASLEGGQDYTWTNDQEYLIDGYVFLEEGGTLTIEAGTIIKAKEEPTGSDEASALIITRGAQIFANGTADAPIIFTSENDDVNDPTDLGPTDRGFWGGLVILGRASITDEADCQNIEGIPSSETRGTFGDCDGNFNDEDNSGVLRYVSIRHGGDALGAGNEINGLTLGAVGSGTIIEFVEVFANFDDGIEWFGGTVNVKNAVVSFCGDDAMDWDTGWKGKGQFWLVMVDENGDNGGEHDGAKPDNNNPESDPLIYNATFVGTSGATRALRFRDGSSGNYTNSIFTGFDTGIEIEATGDEFDSESNFLNGDLELNCNIWWNNGSNTPNEFISIADPNEGNLDAVIQTIVDSGNVIEDPALTSLTFTPGNMDLDPRPATDSPVFDNVCDLPANDPYFQSVPYKGAFGENIWIAGWTALANQDFFPVSVEDIELTKLGYTLSQNTPNPANNLTQIGFELPKSTNISLVIYDMSGKVVASPLDNANMQAGIHILDVNVSNLQSGMYYYSLTNNEVTISKRLIIQ